MKIPEEIGKILDILKKNGFDSYIVGGSVRDILLNRKPKDWDITTNANPEEIQGLFPHTFYENAYGTVGIVNDETEDITLKQVEVTPYRVESGYSDFRHPDQVKFSQNLEDDLKRRDFTINALALSLPEGERQINKGQTIDLYKGQEDLKEKVIRTVGEGSLRFKEDALRMLRAVRLATELGFKVSHETTSSIKLHVKLLENISKERVKDEFVGIIMSSEPMKGMIMCQELGILSHIFPELEETIGIEQNKQAHKYTVWEHLLRSLQHAADKNWPLEVRLAALFHDVSKPQTKRQKAGDTTFYGHDVVGARVTREALLRLKFPMKLVEKVEKLVRWHMFFADTEQISLSAVRRLIVNVGKENIWDLMNVRACDRIGTGRPKESPYRLRKYHAMIEEAMHDPISPQMLKIDGKRLMEVTGENPSRKIGYILHALLEEVIEDASKNNSDFLEKRALELVKLGENELKTLGEAGKASKEKEEEKLIAEIRGKHYVK